MNKPYANITYYAALAMIDDAKHGIADADTRTERETLGTQLLELAESITNTMPHLAARAALWANCAFDTGTERERNSTYLIGLTLERAHTMLKNNGYFEGIVPAEGNTVTITDLHDFLLDRDETEIGSCHVRRLLAERDIMPIEDARMALAQYAANGNNAAQSQAI